MHWRGSLFVTGVVMAIITVGCSFHSSPPGDIQENRDGNYTYVPSEDEIVVDDETSITYYENLLNVMVEGTITEKEAKAMARIVNGELVGYPNEEDAVHVLERKDNVTDANVIHPADLQ